MHMNKKKLVINHLKFLKKKLYRKEVKTIMQFGVETMWVFMLVWIGIDFVNHIGHVSSFCFLIIIYKLIQCIEN